MTGITVARSLVARIGGPGMATTGFMIVGMATVGTVGAISGQRTAMIGITAAMRTVVETAGPGMRSITAGCTSVGMAINGTVGEHFRHEHWMIRHLRAWPAG